MPITPSDLQALDRAIASSELEVQFADRRVRYRSVDEMLRARAHLEQLLAQEQGSRRRYRFDFRTYRGD